jgi:DivIVA domain-containing protein
VTVSPDDIERRTFVIEDRGYQRDEVREYLFEVAAALREAQTLLTGAEPDEDAEPDAEAGGEPLDFDRLGAEVAAVLRAAHETAAAQNQSAEEEAAALIERARVDADAIRRQAEADVAWEHDRAHRVLIAAQDQAKAVIAEAEAQARTMIVTAREQAAEHTHQVEEQARRHAELILRAERDALRRLHDARSKVSAVIDALTESESQPLVDLTSARARITLGSDRVQPVSSFSAADPLARLVQSAVRSAVDAAGRHAAVDATSDDEPGDDEPARPETTAVPDAAATTTDASTVDASSVPVTAAAGDTPDERAPAATADGPSRRPVAPIVARAGTAAAGTEEASSTDADEPRSPHPRPPVTARRSPSEQRAAARSSRADNMGVGPDVFGVPEGEPNGAR